MHFETLKNYFHVFIASFKKFLIFKLLKMAKAFPKFPVFIKKKHAFREDDRHFFLKLVQLHGTYID